MRRDKFSGVHQGELCVDPGAGLGRERGRRATRHIGPAGGQLLALGLQLLQLRVGVGPVPVEGRAVVRARKILTARGRALDLRVDFLNAVESGQLARLEQGLLGLVCRLLQLLQLRRFLRLGNRCNRRRHRLGTPGPCGRRRAALSLSLRRRTRPGRSRCVPCNFARRARAAHRQAGGQVLRRAAAQIQIAVRVGHGSGAVLGQILRHALGNFLDALLQGVARDVPHAGALRPGQQLGCLVAAECLAHQLGAGHGAQCHQAAGLGTHLGGQALARRLGHTQLGQQLAVARRFRLQLFGRDGQHLVLQLHAALTASRGAFDPGADVGGAAHGGALHLRHDLHTRCSLGRGVAAGSGHLGRRALRFHGATAQRGLANLSGCADAKRHGGQGLGQGWHHADGVLQNGLAGADKPIGVLDLARRPGDVRRLGGHDCRVLLRILGHPQIEALGDASHRRARVQPCRRRVVVRVHVLGAGRFSCGRRLLRAALHALALLPAARRHKLVERLGQQRVGASGGALDRLIQAGAGGLGRARQKAGQSATTLVDAAGNRFSELAKAGATILRLWGAIIKLIEGVAALRLLVELIEEVGHGLCAGN